VIKRTSFGNNVATGSGRRVPLGNDPMTVVRYASDSLRCLSVFDCRSDTWYANCAIVVGAVSCSDCCFKPIDFALKLVSVKLAAFGLVFPTFSFGFWGELRQFPARNSIDVERSLLGSPASSLAFSSRLIPC